MKLGNYAVLPNPSQYMNYLELLEASQFFLFQTHQHNTVTLKEYFFFRSSGFPNFSNNTKIIPVGWVGGVLNISRGHGILSVKLTLDPGRSSRAKKNKIKGTGTSSWWRDGKCIAMFFLFERLARVNQHSSCLLKEANFKNIFVKLDHATQRIQVNIKK